MISLDPKTLGEVLGDVRTVAEATGRRDAGVELVRDAAARIDRVRLAVRGAEPARVAALEWLDPVYVAGHWTPQLIEYAGGEDLLGQPGEHSRAAEWEEVAAIRPEVVVVMPCGYDEHRAARRPRASPTGSRARCRARGRGRRRRATSRARAAPHRRVSRSSRTSCIPCSCPSPRAARARSS